MARKTLIERALAELESTIREREATFGGPNDVVNYVRLRLGGREREVFAVVFLDSQHRVIGFEELFFGTIDCATVHPREVVKAALLANAAAVCLAHNHPSGVAEPSRADIAITERLRAALGLVEVRVLDHVVVTAGGAVSFVERGLL